MQPRRAPLIEPERWSSSEIGNSRADTEGSSWCDEMGKGRRWVVRVVPAVPSECSQVLRSSPIDQSTSRHSA